MESMELRLQKFGICSAAIARRLNMSRQHFGWKCRHNKFYKSERILLAFEIRKIINQLAALEAELKNED